MKRWIRKLEIPAVPDDTEEREKALSTATRNLRVVRNQDCAVDAMAESVTQHSTRNHFIERLEWAYGTRR